MPVPPRSRSPPVRRAAAAKPTPAADKSSSDKTLNWANWAAYIDEDDNGDYPTLVAFTDETGIEVNYEVAVDDNNTYYGKVKDQLALGQDIGADTVCLTDWMVGRWIRFGYTQELDHANIPNLANLTPALQNPDFDPGRKFSVPWQGGFAGICWNKEAIPGGLASVDDLWNSELKGRVGVLSEMRDTMGLIMLQNGVDISGEWGDAEYTEAIEILREQVESGQVRNIKGNSYLEDLKSEDTLAAICWSGDITVINAEAGDKWEFAIPDRRRHPVERQLPRAHRLAAQDERRDAHQLLLRARGRRRGGRVGELHHARSSAPRRRPRRSTPSSPRTSSSSPTRRRSRRPTSSARSPAPRSRSTRREFQSILLGA